MRRIESPLRPGWTMEEFTTEEAWAEKEYEYYVHYSPAQRILFGEELRISAYGHDAVNARLSRLPQVLECPWG